MFADEKIVYECQRGDSVGFGVLYEKYIRKIYDFIYYKTYHKETAEDLASKTFFKAWKGIKDFSQEKGTFQAWLYRIARNTVIDFYRTEKQVMNIEDIWDLSDGDDAMIDIDVKMKMADVREYIKRLPAEQRDVLIMRIWQELSYKEIAEITGRTEASCKMAYSRAISKLRAEMPLTLFLGFLLFA